VFQGQIRRITQRRILKPVSIGRSGVLKSLADSSGDKDRVGVGIGPIGA